MELWPHQQEAVKTGLHAVESDRRAGLWVICTGGGKTVTFSTFARLLDVPTLVLVHRDFLIRQTVRTVRKIWPEVDVGVVQRSRNEWDKKFVVASVQTLHKRRRAEIPRDKFGLLISDEAHHSVADGWSGVVEHFGEVGFHLGVTATADRLDGRGLAKHFGREPLFVYQIRDGIADGVLVPVRQYAIDTSVNLDGVERRHGDFVAKALSKVLNTPARNKMVVDAYLRYAFDRRAAIFCVDVEHVNAMAQAFQEAGVPTVAIVGTKVKDRAKDLADFAAGKVRVAVNCQVLTEGWDDPGVECVVMARATQSRSLYIQMAGRGLRISPDTGKSDCLILDAVDACRDHKLVTICNLLGTVRATDAGGRDVLEVVKEEEVNLREEREHAKAKEFTFPLEWRLREVSPWPGLPSLEGYRPTKKWHGQPATEKQYKRLRSFGVAVSRKLTKGEAAWLIDKAVEYEFVFPMPATGSQEWFLKDIGEWEEGLTRREASGRIGAFKRKQHEAKVSV